jgi:epoxyqueuosine reductase QueG
MTLNQEITEHLGQAGCEIIGFADLRGVPIEALKRTKAYVTGIFMAASYAQGDTTALLDAFTNKAVSFLTERGYKAKTGVTPLKMLGTLSGAGWIGRSAMLTTERLGPALRLTGVLTDAVFEYGTPITRSKCPPDCDACADICPAGAIKEGLWEYGVHRDDFFDVEACKKGRSAMKCKAKCIWVCPFTVRFYDEE